MVPALLVALLLQQQAATVALPQAVEGDFVIKDFRFNSGETLPELKIHYRTLGAPQKNAQGVVTNAVLIMHGTGGTGGQFSGRGFARRAVPPRPTARHHEVLHRHAGRHRPRQVE